jgi:SAM-dependent methyltransferase
MGDFLYVAQKYYPKVSGIEISITMAHCIEKNLGVKVFVGQFKDFQTDIRFSCINMSHVLEHIPNPNEWMQKAKTLLGRDGVLVVSVPNMFSLDRKFRLLLKNAGLHSGRWKKAWRKPDHLFEPTIPAMLRFFKHNRYKVLSYYTYSRRDVAAKSLFSRLYQRRFHLGSKMRFYVTPIN